MAVTLLVLRLRKMSTLYRSPLQHNCTATASDPGQPGAHWWIDSFGKPAAKTVPFGRRRSANLCKNRLIRWPDVSDRDTILSEY
jgi:hypothetical protein